MVKIEISTITWRHLKFLKEILHYRSYDSLISSMLHSVYITDSEVTEADENEESE